MPDLAGWFCEQLETHQLGSDCTCGWQTADYSVDRITRWRAHVGDVLAASLEQVGISDEPSGAVPVFRFVALPHPKETR